MSSWRRQLLPGELRGEPGGSRSARDWLVDLAMALASVLLSVAVAADTWPQRPVWMRWADAVAGLAVFESLWWRRQHPDRVGIFAAAVSTVSGVAGGPALVAAFNCAVRSSRRGLYAVLAISAVSLCAFPVLWPPHEGGYLLQIVIGVLLLAVAFGWGFLVRVRRDQIRGIREGAVTRAREAERQRIAREMHDVLAHRLSLLSLHAGALEFRPDAPPEQVAEAAAVIRSTARAALEDLREVIGVLRDGDAGGTPEAPQPTLRDLAALVEDARAAGLRIEARLPEVAGVPTLAARTAYRVVQEGLTNASKHAPGAAVEVELRGGDPLEVVVVSRPPVGVATTREPATREPLPGSGSGLVGLTERVSLAGGTLDHGLSPAGDFILRARLPWSAS